MTTKVGLFLPARESLLAGASTADVLDFAERAEDAGFDSIWTGDSLLASPILEPLTLLAAVAARFSSSRSAVNTLTATTRSSEPCTQR